MRTHKLYKFLLLLTCLSLILGACKPAPAPVSSGPAATKENVSTTKVPTQNQNGIKVIDNGAPLLPQVIARVPAGGEELPTDGQIRLDFDQAMDPAKTAAALQVFDPQGKTVSGQVSWPDAQTLEFKPATLLETGALYFASLEAGAASATGAELAEPYGFQFQTASDLQVSQVFPADGAADVASDAVITVIFNRPVTALVIAEEQKNLPSPVDISPQIKGAGEWVNTSVYAFRPEGGLKAGVSYTVTVNAGLKDAAGESALASDYSWTFSTAQPGVDNFSLSDGRYNPQNGADKVLLDEYFSIKFLQSMDRLSTESALSLTSQNGAVVQYKTEWEEEDTTLVFTPTQRLALDSNYTLRLDSAAQAATGGSLKDGIDWNFSTIPAPGIVSTHPANNETQGHFYGEISVQFASPMRLDTVKSHIVITPQPKEDPQWYYNDWDWSINAYFLEPSTRYEIRFQPGMQDIYGNQTTKETVIHFTTAANDPAARLVMPYDTPMLRLGVTEGQEFYVSHTNVNSLTLSLYSLTQAQFIGLMSGKQDQYQYNPPASTLVWQTKDNSGGKQNERVLAKYSPQMKDGSPLAPGFYFLGLDAPGVDHTGTPFADRRLLFVANANLTFKTAPTDGLVWVTDLTSGKPLSGKPVVILDDGNNVLGDGKTDSDGMLHVDLPAPKDNYYGSRFAVVQDGDSFGFASSQWGSGVNASDYGVWIDMYAPANQPTAYVYTERPIYRPGQPVYFKGILRVDNDLDYSIPDVKQVRVKISSYEETVYDENLSLSDYGTFDAKFILDNNAALGAYTIEVLLPDRDMPVGSVGFNVAEYRKPEFQVSVTASPQNVLSGEKFNAVVQADYYSGGGVAGANVSWSLTSDPFYFQPPDDYATYSFSDAEQDVWGYSDDGENGSKVVAQGTGVTDATGRFTVEVPIDLSEYKAGRTLTFEASITDVAQTSVSGRTSIIAHKSKVYPGIRSHSYVGKQGEEQSFDLILLNWDGVPLPDQGLNVSIVERKWYSVQEQDPSGRVTWKTSVQETPVQTFDPVTTDADGKASVSFTPQNGGIFRARVTAKDDQGNEGAASAFLWVAGDEYIPWQQTNDRGFALITDKKSYEPGDTAEVLIASPFQGETYALVTVERGRIRKSEVILLKNNSTIYKLPITPDLAPNAYISVMVVKGVDDTNPRPNFKMGIAAFQVDTSRQTITVEVTPDHDKVGPGDQVTYTVKTTDADGKPVSAELSLSLSDLATLSLLPPNSAPILDHFYSKRNLAVWTSMTLVNNLEDYNVEIADQVQTGEGGGSGGGKGDGEGGVIPVRSDFPDTALWEAHVVTGDNGEATVTVTLPDNLTTWRMDARAVTKDTHVGQTTNDVISTRPLLVRPQTPRFFITNDQATLGAAVHNNTQESLTVTVSLDAKGLKLNGPAEQDIAIPANSQALVTWQAQVDRDAERVDLVFRAHAKGTISGELDDASRPTAGTLDNNGIPVYHYAAPETVGTSGQMSAGDTRVEGIALPQTMTAYDGQLTIKVSPSLAAGMTDSLQYLKSFPYDCLEQTVSRFLPNVLTAQALKAAGLSDPDLENGLADQVNVALQALYKWQNLDGGWGWWGNDKSDPLTSAYVVLGLYEAGQAGYTVTGAVLERSLNYLSAQVQPLQGLQDPYLVNRQAFILYVLAHAGKPDVSSTVQLFEQRQRMFIYSQSFLAQTLWEIDKNDPRIQTLLADFNSQAVVSATGTHWEEKESDIWNWNTDTRTTAIVLAALSQIDPANPINANAVRWLMSSRTGGHWKGTQETAWTIMALTHWMVNSGELKADYDWAVALNGSEVGSGTANQTTLRETKTLQVGIQDLLKDAVNRLAFASKGASGNLYYTAHLEVSLPVDKIEPLDRGIVVSRSYYRMDNTETPVTDAKQGELLLARLTVVAPYALHYIVVDDPLPAGLEAVDQSLNTSQQSVEVPQQSFSFDDLWRRGWGWWAFNHIQYRDEKVVLSADYLPAGTYVYTYLVRASTPGVFQVIPTTAQEFYFPEVYGRGAGSLFTVNP